MNRLKDLVPDVFVTEVANPVRVPASTTSPNVGVSKGELSVLFAGEVGRRKGVDVLLAAWATVRLRLPTAVLRLAGPVRMELGMLPDSVRVLGPLTSEEVQSEFAVADLAVLPSRAENQPMFLLEAMSHGIPFVSTPVGGIAELAQFGGVLTPLEDPEELARAIISLLENPDRRAAIGATAQAYVMSRSAEVIAGQFAELFAGLVVRKSV